LGLWAPVLFNTVDNCRWLVFSAGASRWPAFTAGFLSRDDYLAANLDYYRVAQFCNVAFRDKEKVLLVGEHRKLHWACRVEGSDWYDQPRILPFLREARDADSLLDEILSAGFTHIFFNLNAWYWPEDPLEQTGEKAVSKGSAWYYNRRFFTRSDILKIQELLRSERLQTVVVSQPGRVYLSRILPSR
jgi:hypothetical protein